MTGVEAMAGPRNLVIAVIVLLALTACSSSPSVRYFSLNPIDTEFRQDPDDAVMLGLGPFRMPDYLNRSQIVTRGANSEMQVDEFSRWSEPLATSLLRIVSTDVDNLLPGLVVVVFPYEPFVRDQVKYRLPIIADASCSKSSGALPTPTARSWCRCGATVTRHRRRSKTQQPQATRAR
jgi:uncharacterized lipoprotein YmbA